MDGVTTSLDERYGARPAWVRPVLVSAAAVVGTVFAGWLAWTAWFHGNPEAESRLVSWSITDVHQARAVVSVQLADGVEASCRVRALAADHHTVGELAFTPVDGRNELTVRTEREATTVELVGCTTPDQPRPR